MKKIRWILICIIFMIIVMIVPNKSFALIRSNSTTHTSPSVNTWANWMTKIRNAEVSGGGMGLEEQINSSTLVPTTDENGIDVHMMKNTEYGAMVLLAASSTYGTSDRDNPKPETTTGNASGIYLNYNNYEYVAGAKSGVTAYDRRYINSYGNAIQGDATTEISSWTKWRKITYLSNSNFNASVRYYNSGWNNYTCSIPTNYMIRGKNAIADATCVSANVDYFHVKSYTHVFYYYRKGDSYNSNPGSGGGTKVCYNGGNATFYARGVAVCL